MICNFRVCCVTCGYDESPATYVVVVDEEGYTHTYCVVCALIHDLVRGGVSDGE